jgi:hypothetical protein
MLRPSPRSLALLVSGGSSHRAMCPRKVTAALGFLAFAAGCAFQDAVVHAPPSGLVRTGARVQGSPAVVLSRSFVDQRPDRSRCGMKKAMSKPSATVHCAEPPASWLAELVAQELRTQGFRVYDSEPPAGQPVVRIAGFLTQLFLEPEVELGFLYGSYIPEADIAVTLVASGEHFVAERRFYFKGAGEYDGGGLESNFQFALNNAVRASVLGLVSAIAELVASAPSFDAYGCSVLKASSAQK